MILSRVWYVLLGLAVAVAMYVVYVAVGQFDRQATRSLKEGLASDSQTVEWALKIDTRRRLDALLVGSVDDVTGSINDGLGKGVTLVDTASGRISDLASQVGAISDAASALASNPNPAPGLSAALSAKLQPLTDRYLALRSAYTDLRTNVVAAADRLQTLDRLLPFISIPQGPADALQTLDSKLQALDASITELLTTPGSGAVNAVAGGIATRAANVEAGLQSLTTALDDVSTRITTLQGNVQQKADQVKLLINVVTLLLILGLLYSVFLHWVLFRSGSSLRARNSGS